MNDNSKNIIEAIVTAMVVVIIVVMSSLIIGTFLDSSIFQGRTIIGTNTNEGLGIVNNITNSTFGILTTQPNAACTLTTINNATGGEILTSGNYTFFTNCRLILTDTSTYIGSSLNATYGFSYTSNISIAGIDVNNLQNQFGLFVTGLIAFLAIIGTIVGVVWLVFYVKQLFDKQTGLQSITA